MTLVICNQEVEVVERFMQSCLLEDVVMDVLADESLHLW